MSWNELPAEELVQLSFPEKSAGLTIKRTPGEPKIIVEKSVPPGDKVVYLRMDRTLHERISRNVAGPVRIAVLAIVEEALDQLESGNEQWSVVSRSQE